MLGPPVRLVRGLDKASCSLYLSARGNVTAEDNGTRGTLSRISTCAALVANPHTSANYVVRTHGLTRFVPICTVAGR